MCGSGTGGHAHDDGHAHAGAEAVAPRARGRRRRPDRPGARRRGGRHHAGRQQLRRADGQHGPGPPPAHGGHPAHAHPALRRGRDDARHALRLTGVDHLHALLGGFHLTGPAFEPVIEPTVAALGTMAPELVLPAHCTGWRAQHRPAAALPDAFVPNAVGTAVTLSADAA